MVALLLFVASLLRTPSTDSARIAGSTVAIDPLGLELTLPPAWVGDRDTAATSPSCGHHLRGAPARRFATSRPMLDSLQHATGEWDQEYSAVVDSILPFAQLVAQLGPEPFSGGTCYADLQLRIYVLDSAPTTGTAEHAPSLAAGFRVAHGLFPSASLASRDSSSWHIDALRWIAWYSDYGAEANVQLYSIPIRNRVAVLVFMRVSGRGGLAERDQQFILDHVRIP